MDLIDTLVQISQHPAVSRMLANWVTGVAGQPTPAAADWEDLRVRVRALELQSAPLHAGAAARGGTGAPDLARTRDQVVAVSASLKEALRLARSDGLDHPEVQRRLQAARDWLQDLPALERYALSPERLQTLPADQRRTWEAVLPTLRQLRQTGNVDSLPALEDAAAAAGTAAVALQTAVTVAPVWTPPPVAAPEGEAPPSAYEPAMSKDQGCIACGRGHLAAVAGVLRALPDHPEEQTARLTFAQEELAALLAYDWTPDRVAKNPPAERVALEQDFIPRVRALQQALAAAQSDPDRLAAVIQEAQALRDAYDAAFPAAYTRQTAAYASLAAAALPVAEGTPRVRRDRIFDLTQPSLAEATAITQPTDTARVFDRLLAGLEARGVHVVVRQLPATPDYILEGQYDPATNTIQLNPAVLIKDSYAVQTLMHEAAHALLHNPTCLPTPPENPAPYEDQAEAAVVLGMLATGLPIETRDGTLIPAGTLEADPARLRQVLGETGAANVTWAAQWIAEVAETGDGPALHATCPLPQTGKEGTPHGGHE